MNINFYNIWLSSLELSIRRFTGRRYTADGNRPSRASHYQYQRRLSVFRSNKMFG